MISLCDSQRVRYALSHGAPELRRWFEACYADPAQEKRYLRAVEIFESHYGPGPLAIFRVPARINLIGEHIDYVSYFRSRVLPFGSREHDMLLLMRPRQDAVIRLATTAPGLEPTQFQYESTAPRDWLAYLQTIGVPEPHWSNYIRGAAFYLQHRVPERSLRGAEMLVDSTIPLAGGASSSSALVVAAGAALRWANGLDWDPAQLAEDSSRAEWYVGTRGGKMDHATMCHGKQGHALRITFEPFSAEPIPMPVEGYRWVTFFTHPAEKGSAVMSEYNERALVSRFLIPRLLESCAWESLRQAIDAGDLAAIRANQATLESLLDLLPEAITLRTVANRYPDSFEELQSLYPALFEVKGMDAPLKVRDRARHHFGEIQRVLEACACLQRAAEADDEATRESAMQRLGALLSETHASLRDRYEVSTPELERVVQIARACEGVYGARVMGGGFGGNVLVLVRQEWVSPLVERMQQAYYQPRNRQVDGNVMISSPGRGLEQVPLSERLQRQRVAWANDWRHIEKHLPHLLALCPEPRRPVQPVIVAAGRGERARRSGLEVPKPLATVLGKPVVRFVLERLLKLPLSWQMPIVVVSPSVASQVRSALDGIPVCFALQEQPLGTADAVWQACEAIRDFEGDTLVIWGTQPVVQPQSLLTTVRVHQATGVSLTFPTTKRQSPYAPIVRDAEGWVMDSRETHQEGAEPMDFGEDNVGAFCLKTPDLCEALAHLHASLYDAAVGCYRTSSGELGFPNQIVRELRRRRKPILALAVADPREAQGIKLKEHIPLVERYLQELARDEGSSS